MKGISTVIAAILLLMIVITLAGTAYMFTSGMLTAKTAKSISLLNSQGQLVVLQNSGTEAIEAGDIKIIVSGQEAEIVNPPSIEPQSSATLRFVTDQHTSCKSILDSGQANIQVISPSNTVPYTLDFTNSGNGVYYIKPTGSPLETYCDMTTDGGGWTLIMKHLKGNVDFDYQANYWETANTLNSDDLTLSAGSSKYESYNTVSFDTIRGCINSPTTNCVEHTFGSTWTSALTLFSGGYREEGCSRQTLFSAFENWECQDTRYCDICGFNLEGSDSGDKIADTGPCRWGWCGNCNGGSDTGVCPVRHTCLDTDACCGFGCDHYSGVQWDINSSSGCDDYAGWTNSPEVPVDAWFYVR